MCILFHCLYFLMLSPAFSFLRFLFLFIFSYSSFLSSVGTKENRTKMAQRMVGDVFTRLGPEGRWNFTNNYIIWVESKQWTFIISILIINNIKKTLQIQFPGYDFLILSLSLKNADISNFKCFKTLVGKEWIALRYNTHDWIGNTIIHKYYEVI